MSGIGVSDWMRLHCGCIVREIEGRHLGRVERIEHSTWVTVRWLDTGWISIIELIELEEVMR